MFYSVAISLLFIIKFICRKINSNNLLRDPRKTKVILAQVSYRSMIHFHVFGAFNQIGLFIAVNVTNLSTFLKNVALCYETNLIVHKQNNIYMPLILTLSQRT